MDHDFTEEEIELACKAFSCTREEAIAQHCAAVRSSRQAIRAEYEANKYKLMRQQEYPSIGDQLDALYHAGVFPPEMAAAIQAVKNKYQKGQ